MNAVDDYFARLKPSQKDVATALRRLVRAAAPDAEERISWGNPCYYIDGPVIYVAASRDHVKLGFFQGAKLADPGGFMEGTGKGMRHIKVPSQEAIKADPFMALIRQAADLNRA